MQPLDRRTFLRLGAAGAGASIAGCLDGVPGEDDPDGIEDYRTVPYRVTTTVPRWRREDEPPVGRVVVIDDEERERAVLSPADVPEERRQELETFFEELDYATSVVVLVESAGPNACYDRLELEDVRIESGELRASATVVDTSDPDTACAQVETYPSALLRVDFEEEPVADVAVSITDGWEQTETVAASPADPLSPDPDELEGDVRPEEDPAPVEPLECEKEGFERHWRDFDEDDVRYGELDVDGESAFALRVEETRYERGDTARIRLQNVSDREHSTGNRHKYAFEVYTEEGWQDVRGHVGDHPLPYTDEAIPHRPGEGFEWRFELTEDGIVADHVHDELEVCPDLPAGRYRFAFWGVVGEEAIAVAFDLE